jgi:hypothetical protein
MTWLIDILTKGVVKTALATCALARRVLSLTGAGSSERMQAYPPSDAMARHAVPPIE